MKQQQTYMTSGITTMIATGGEIGDVVARCLQAHNDGIWDYFEHITQNWEKSINRNDKKF